MRCPVCNTENPETAKFCNSCGNRMPERKTTGSSERKVVTVLFCDVKGSTTLAEKMDPEEWTEIIDGAFKVLTPPIQRYGGTVARLLGDAVLAFFGAPVAHEDDAPDRGGAPPPLGERARRRGEAGRVRDAAGACARHVLQGRCDRVPRRGGRDPRRRRLTSTRVSEGVGTGR